MIKLVFPNGDHEQYELQPGETTVGSSDDCDVVLKAAGIADHHAQFIIDENSALVGVHDATNITRVNGNLVAAKTRLKSGDALLFASIPAQIVGDVPGGKAVSRPAQAKPKEEKAGQTVVRMAVPKFILRGVSGSTFGKNFPLHGTTVVGRHSECDICLPADEISRKHASLQVAADGLYVEDMGSANGTFVNNKRVRRAKLEPGDELKLDTVRFLVQAPGQETPAKKTDQSETAESAAPEVEEKKSGAGKWIIIVVILLGAAAAGLRYGGII